MKDLAKPFDMALPSFLQHLQVLEDSGLLTSKKTGRVRVFQLEPAPFLEAEHWMDRRRREWKTRLDQLDRLLLQMKEEQKMTEPMKHIPNPDLDLLLEREIDVAPELVWRAWTTPELMLKWFTPAPWRTAEIELDLRPGGIFRTKMQGPEGEEFEGSGCVLEVVERRKLVWTSALGPGYRPQVAEEGSFAFTAVITIEPSGSGTKYSALAIHSDEAGRKQHAEMGFHDGWGAALQQLVDLMKSQ